MTIKNNESLEEKKFYVKKTSDSELSSELCWSTLILYAFYKVLHELLISFLWCFFSLIGFISN